MGFDCNLFCEQTASAIGQMGHSAGAASHAIGELSKALNGYSSSLPFRQTTEKRLSTIVKMSIIRKSGLPERQTTDVLEKSFGPFNKGDLIFHKDGWNFN